MIGKQKEMYLEGKKIHVSSSNSMMMEMKRDALCLIITQ